MFSNFFNHCPISFFFNFLWFWFWFQFDLLFDKPCPGFYCTLCCCHHHHCLHHCLYWIRCWLCLCSLCRSISFWMFVRAILTSTVCTKFTFNFWVQVKTSLSVCACWKILTLLFWMHKWTGLTVFTIWKMLAFYLFFLT